jgi:hypothetical protein
MKLLIMQSSPTSVATPSVKYTDVSKERAVSMFTVEKQAKKNPASACSLLIYGFFFDLYFDPEEGRHKFFRNVDVSPPNYTALELRCSKNLIYTSVSPQVRGFSTLGILCHFRG